MTKIALRWIEFAVLFVLIVTYGWATYERNFVWKDDLSLWSDVVEKSPYKARGYNEIGMYYYERQMPDNAIPFFQKSLSLQPDFAKAHNNLGLCFMAKGLTDRAIIELQNAVEDNPDNGMYHINLGIAYFQKGLYDAGYKEIQTGKYLRRKYSPNRPSPHG
jgi:tetratricopeptide (TPR) repeat protein